MEKGQPFQEMVLELTKHPYTQEMNQDVLPTPFTKINSK